MRTKIERSDNVQKLEFSVLMKPIVNKENLGREGRGTIKEKITENYIGRKLELPRMRNSAESFALSKLIENDLQGGEDKGRGRTNCAGMECWRRRTKEGSGLADNSVETLISRAGTSASIMDGVMR